MTIVIDTAAPPCAHAPEVYQDEQLHSPPARSDVSTADWDALAAKRATAHRRCAGCAIFVDCLYRAVVEVDVSGFAACTTESDRRAIRRQLGVDVQPTGAIPYGAARASGGPVSHDAVVAIRQAHPRETCHQLAQRLGCSTSTIKRHLRRARERDSDSARTPPGDQALPTVDAVLDCFDQLETSRVA